MLVGTPIFLLMLITPFPAAWGLIFLAEFCLLLNTGPANAVLANVTQPAIRASAFAINIFLIHLLGDAISPPLVGWITGLAGGNMNFGFAAVSAATALSGVLWLSGIRFLAADTAAVGEADEPAGRLMAIRWLGATRARAKSPLGLARLRVGFRRLAMA